MTTGAPRDITPLLTNGYQVKIGEYIARGWELMLPNIGQFMIYTFIFNTISLIIILIFFLIAIIPILGWLLAPFLIVIYGAITTVLQVGFFLYSLKLVRNESVSFSNFFDGFSRMVEYSVLGIVESFFTSLAFTCCIIPGIYLNISYQFAFFFMADQGSDFWPAMEMSRKLITKNFFPVLGFVFLLGLINIGGVLACGLGLLLTLPLTYMALTVAYMDIMNQGAGTDGANFS